MTEVFVRATTATLSELIQSATKRVILSAPGVDDAVASALVNASTRLGRSNVRVVVDVDAVALRLGYGSFDAVAMLREHGVDVRDEPGIRAGTVVADDGGFAYFAPPLLVETLDDARIGPNALRLCREQADAIAHSILPAPPAPEAAPPPPAVGSRPLRDEHLENVQAEIERNPPQRFDLARALNVFNAYVEFIDLRLEGMSLSRNTVQLPNELVLALKDDETVKRLAANFKLIPKDSKLGKTCAEFEKVVRGIRTKYLHPLGPSLGSVALRSKRPELEAAVKALRARISAFSQQVLDGLRDDLEASRRKLVDGLMPAMKKSPPEQLLSQVTGKPTVDVIRRYVDDRLAAVFPKPESLIREMRLEFVPKGVTYEMLKDGDFQKRVREALPYEDWDKPFEEFDAAPAESKTLELFR